MRDHLRERQTAEEALRRAHDALETLVEQRTAALRRLSVKLLRVQDEERRRIARELHDSLGQDLTAAKISLDMLAQECKATMSPHLRDARTLVDRSISDTRTFPTSCILPCSTKRDFFPPRNGMWKDLASAVES